MSVSMAAPLNAVCKILARDSLRSLPDRELLEKFATGTESAFAVLVDRHGPLVRTVCLRALRDANLADDAFQATFLVLAQKARSLQTPDALAGWLFTVARRVAGQVRRQWERQRRRDVEFAKLRPETGSAYPWDDLLEMLDEELTKLPQRLRSPLVACYLQGRTQDEAARELGWPLITLRRRLEAGREFLHARMKRRGATLSATLLAAAIETNASYAVTPALAQGTIAYCGALVPGAAPPPHLAAILQEVLSAGATRHIQAALFGLVAVGVLIGVGTIRPWHSRPHASPLPEPPPAKADDVKRDRFNDPLPAGAVARLGTVAWRHGSEIGSLTFSADGNTLASHGGGVTRTWQVATGHETRNLDLRARSPEDLRLHSLIDGGETVIATFQNRRKDGLWLRDVARVEVWNSKTNEKVREFKLQDDGGHQPNIERLIASPKGRFLGVEQSSGELHVWNCDTEQKAFTISAPARVRAFSADDRLLITSGHEHQLIVWDTATGREIKRLGSHGSQPTRAAMSPDGKWLATLGYNLGAPKPVGKGPSSENLSSMQIIPEMLIRLWNVEKGQLAIKIETGFEAVGPMSFAPDGRSLHLAGNGSVHRWEVPSGKAMGSFPKAIGSPSALAFSPDGKFLAAANTSGCIRMFDLVAQREMTATEGHTAGVYQVAYSEAGDSLLALDHGRKLIEWNSSSAKPLRQFSEPEPRGGMHIATNNVRYRAVAELNPKDAGRLFVQDVIDNRIVRTLGTAPQGVSALALSRDGLKVTVGSGWENGQRIQTWDVTTGKLLHAWDLKREKRQQLVLHHLPGNRLLATSIGSATIFDNRNGMKLAHWNVLDNERLATDLFHPPAIFPSPSGEQVACVLSQSGEIILCETITGKVIQRFAVTDLASHPLAFSADGKLAVCSAGHTPSVHVWNTKSGRKLGTFAGHRGGIRCLSFRADGRRLVSGSADTSILIWDLPE